MIFAILQEVIMLVHARGAPLPAEAAIVEEAIGNVALGFSSITAEDAVFLSQVDEGQGDVRPSADRVGQFARLLHTHMILAHLNHENWYEIHPLARRALGLPEGPAVSGEDE
ncbi:MAG: hypothetical protein ACR2MA_10685 [Egibacteraceae bacterium]